MKEQFRSKNVLGKRLKLKEEGEAVKTRKGPSADSLRFAQAGLVQCQFPGGGGEGGAVSPSVLNDRFII